MTNPTSKEPAIVFLEERPELVTAIGMIHAALVESKTSSGTATLVIRELIHTAMIGEPNRAYPEDFYFEVLLAAIALVGERDYSHRIPVEPK